MARLYLTKSEALKRHPLTEDELETLINEEPVTCAIVKANDHEFNVIYDDDLAAYVADRDITPEKFKHLRGNLMNMNQASLNYGVSSSTIHRWVQRGLLKLREDTGNEKLVDEADVAYMAALAKAKKMRKGKRSIFD